MFATNSTSVTRTVLVEEARRTGWVDIEEPNMSVTKDGGQDGKQEEGKADRRTMPEASRAVAPTLDENEQGEQAIALIDQLYDAAQDEAVEEDAPRVSAAARRLATSAQRMVDDLPRYIVTHGQAKVARAGQGSPSDGRPLDLTTLDTARIRAMSREQLEGLINRLRGVRGDAPTTSFDGLSDEELQEMARHLRAAPRAAR